MPVVIPSRGISSTPTTEGRLAPVCPLVPGGGAGGGKNPEDGVRQNGRQPRNDGSQAEEEIAALGHVIELPAYSCRLRNFQA